MNLASKLAVKITAFLTTKNFQGRTIVLALSGGPDSVFLFHLLLQVLPAFPFRLLCLHINHRWRLEADEEEVFCRELAAKYNIPIVVHYPDEVDLHNQGSLEALGRDIRQTFFKKVIGDHDAAAVLLAHHKDDQLETFFIKAIRGTSLLGLGGMLEYRPPFFRPLLDTTKEEILTYLTQNGIPFCVDQSNNSLLFLRNRVRHELLPVLRKIDPRAGNKIVDTMRLLQQEVSLLDALVLEKFQNLCGDGAHPILDLSLFLQM